MKPGIIQLVCVGGIFVLAAAAAASEKWDIVSVAMAGGFALLRGGNSE